MKKPIVVLLHAGYWLLYCFLLLFIYALIYGATKTSQEGIGVQFGKKNGELIVEKIIEDGPAAKQGLLRTGDVIVNIQSDDRTLVVGQTNMEMAREMVRGKKGTSINLSVRRKGHIEHLKVIRGEFKTASGPGRSLWFIMFLELGLIPGVITFYLFYGFLFSRFLSRGRITLFVLLAIVTPMLVAVPSEVLMYFTFSDMNWMFESIFGFGIIISINALMNGIIGLVVRGFVSWYGDIKIKEELARKNHETELALIKSQINPHFLFNTLNNIDVLILKDPAKASEYLNKLSDIMRFMLYESSSQKIPLSKELGYIEKYVELQKIRSSNPRFIRYDFKGYADGIMIEPMLFIPFIENAFKHAENNRIEEAVRLSFEIEKKKITFECVNHFSKVQQQRPKYSGLGNELIRRRLMLLYPNSHILEVNEENDVYSVKLELTTE
ncbi:MAG: histidine kinase [Bacteroidia bacterium]|nr:histidine kinase [Bacteroidia bacterium]